MTLPREKQEQPGRVPCYVLYMVNARESVSLLGILDNRSQYTLYKALTNA